MLFSVLKFHSCRFYLRQLSNQRPSTQLQTCCNKIIQRPVSNKTQKHSLYRALSIFKYWYLLLPFARSLLPRVSSAKLSTQFKIFICTIWLYIKPSCQHSDIPGSKCHPDCYVHRYCLAEENLHSILRVKTVNAK